MVKSASNQVLLTQDYTTDPSGTILSMSYTPTENFGGTYAGELFVSYDPCGNLSLLTNATGSPALSASYNSATGIRNAIWNPDEIELPIFNGAKGGDFTLPKPWAGEEIVFPRQPGIIKDITDGYTVTVTPDGTGVTSCSPCDEVGLCGSDEGRERTCINRCFAHGGWDALASSKNPDLMNFGKPITTPPGDGSTCGWTDAYRRVTNFLSII